MCVCHSRWFDKDYEKQKKLFDEINEIVQPYISNHQENFDPNDPKDFMDVYLNEISSTNDVNSSFYGKRGEESLISTMFDLFIAGKWNSYVPVQNLISLTFDLKRYGNNNFLLTLGHLISVALS